MEKRLTLTAAALTLAMIGLLPVLAMISNTFYGQGGFSLAAYGTLLGSGKELVPLIGHSLFLSVFVTFFAIVLGVPLGVLLGRTDLPLRRAFAVMLTLPLLVPPMSSRWRGSTSLGQWDGWGAFCRPQPPNTYPRTSSASMAA